ncbi:hypothetical protein PHMEG_0007862 [Phytophthora megakarya]|uniref:Reverse transcriptase RNase H-like domain-containing protein n=1 Tax=Phytophthora megakarya TaxID=4795 RepID=A0A225WM69_9STRA|nr:hypothetical protein PHMEG_0007862 [Phytophthora megakarya]
MTFPDANADILFFTDASGTIYGIVVTQVRDWDASLPVDKQNHELVVCKGGTFKHSELNWSVVEKEAFLIVYAYQDLEYLLHRPKGFRLFCDHANLAYIFAPDVELKKHVRDQLQRWAMRLCGVHCTIEHIRGEQNVWADIISRWHTCELARVAAVQTRSHHVVPVSSLARPRPLSDDNFVFPTHDEKEAPRERSSLPPFEEEDSTVTIDGCLWVPAAAKELLARIFIIAHCGAHGHRGQEPIVLVIKERFFIARLEVKVAKFVRECLLCKHFKGPRLITRPYGPLLTPTQRNEIVHWDFLTLGEGFGDAKYLLS